MAEGDAVAAEQQQGNEESEKSPITRQANRVYIGA